MMDCFKKQLSPAQESHHVMLHGNSVVFDLGEGKYQVRDRFSGELQHELQYSGSDNPKEVFALGNLGWAVSGFEVLSVYSKGKGGGLKRNSYPTCVNAVEGALYIPATGVIMAWEWVNTFYNSRDFDRLSFIAPETADRFHQLKVPDGGCLPSVEVRKDGSLLLCCDDNWSDLDKKGYGIDKFRDVEDRNWAFIEGASLSFEDVRKKLKFHDSIVVGSPGGGIVGYSTEDGFLRACELDGTEYIPIELTTGVKPEGEVRLFNGHFLISVTPDSRLLIFDLVKGDVKCTFLSEKLSIHRQSREPLLILKNDSDHFFFYDANTDSLKPTPLSTVREPWFNHLNRNTVLAHDFKGARSIRLIDIGKHDIQVEELPGMGCAWNTMSDGDDDLWLVIDGVSYRSGITELKERCFGC